MRRGLLELFWLLFAQGMAIRAAAGYLGGDKTPLSSPHPCDHLSEDGDCEDSHSLYSKQARKLLVNSLGTVKVLVIPMRWSDFPKEKTLVPIEQLDELWNGQGVSDVIPGGSIANYTRANSYGKFELVATVVEWGITDNTEAYYADGRSGEKNGGGDSTQTLTRSGDNNGEVPMEEAFVPLLKKMDAAGFDFSEFDQNDDMVIDVVSFLHSGYSAELNQGDCYTGATRPDQIRSFASKSVYDGWTSSAGYKLGYYTIASAYQGSCNSVSAKIGSIAHEFIHLFGVPDLYDLDGTYQDSTASTGGLGGYDIMSSPFGQGDKLSFPGHLSPWTKMKLGWLEPTQITSDGKYYLRPSELYPDAYIIREPFPENEYLLIEVRRPLLFDSLMWDNGGILIYHVDENGDTQGGNRNRGFPGQSGWPSNGKHYEVALVQRDGKYELEKAINFGHIEDFWVGGQDLSLGPGNGKTIYPNTDSYQNGNIQVTGITIFNFVDGDDFWASFEVKGMPSGIAPVPPPTTHAAQPTIPATQPTTPAAQPTSPAAQPTSPAAQPTSPATQPTNPASQPAAKTTEPSGNDAQPGSMSSSKEFNLLLSGLFVCSMHFFV